MPLMELLFCNSLHFEMLISFYLKKILNFEMHNYYRFLIGRENNSENSEIAQLISQSIQADKEHQKPTIYQVVFSFTFIE